MTYDVSGAPQGPVLFALHLKDIPMFVAYVIIFMYGNDDKLCLSFKALEGP